MKNDKLLLTSFIGIVSTIPAEIISHLFVYFGFGKYSIYQLASLLITFNRPNFIIGLIVDFIIGGVIANLICYSLEKLGSEYLIIKAIMASFLSWLVCELAFTFSIEGRYFDLRPIGDYYNNILCAGIFGITLGLLFKKFLFRKSIS
ncbi:hypothetical protein JK636_22970 [Clostridium sp. YIM B02515]|uniref:Uncharacterized protein n=1 Tax=Clostridium rhizosphaerae TaxID=2803861 RepID=A0ABS1TJ05_9CLOT|nr:hypothetical protein [Clostridium rhizosphaerae]MBL4938571.1 hypothetical protein [Clostridium rhizosphaerae]